MERLSFLPCAIVIALVAHSLTLTYVGYSVAIGIFLAIVAIARKERSISPTTPGYAFVWLGIALLGLAYFVCNKYGISFEALDRDRSFPKSVRRLPYYGLSSLTAGLTVIVISIFRK